MITSKSTEPRVLVDKPYTKVASFKSAEYLVSISDLLFFTFDWYQFVHLSVQRGFYFVDPIEIDPPPLIFWVVLTMN